MGFDETEAEIGSMDQLAGQDDMGGGMEGGSPEMPGAPMPGGESGGQSPGGPGVDTPQEQQAVKLLMQGAQAFRKAAQIEPSVRYIVDKLLQEGFMSITKHYGMEQEGKLAMQQAKLGADKQKSAAFNGPPAPPSFE